MMSRSCGSSKDGATCHTAHYHHNRFIERHVWATCKVIGHMRNHKTLDHLEDNIRRVIADIRPQMLKKSSKLTSGLDYIRASRKANPMPEIIFKNVNATRLAFE
ncbi:hypothetical protein TNCV_1145861 [Trichonephila clavipes]|nr:hypothetical protein TNCV_1145861 [Trichonephila clavipes]